MSLPQEILPQLFRTEFSKMVAVLTKQLGLHEMALAEDVVSETFLQASETWREKGLPANPTAWLYTVAKNKALTHLKRQQVFHQKVTPEVLHNQPSTVLPEEWSDESIRDKQLQMIFAVCHPEIPAPAQIGLALRILCGLGIDEIAEAFLESKESTNKRLYRARQKLKALQIAMEMPPDDQLPARLEQVAATLYLLFNEGYHSSVTNTTLRRDLCLEAMRLNLLLLQHPACDTPMVRALLALMCFHASRFDARLNPEGAILLYEEQDRNLWDWNLVKRGEVYLNRAAEGDQLSKYHLEAAIAYWHTQPDTVAQKWTQILSYYNRLLQVEYSPIAALNRTYALAKAQGPQKAIAEGVKLDLEHSHFYHALMGELYAANGQYNKAKLSLDKGISLARSSADREVLVRKRSRLEA